MTNDPTGDKGQHDELVELLPWYVNGTLEAGERRSIEEHLAICAECRSELAWLRELASRVAASGPLPMPHPSQFDRLVERVSESSTETVARPPVSGAWRRAGPWRWVVVAQAASLLVLVAWLLAAPTASPVEPALRTLATPATALEGIRLRVVFDEQAREGELRALLVPLGATIVGGPSPLGVYTLVLPPDSTPLAAAAALRNRPLVEFAEPVGP